MTRQETCLYNLKKNDKKKERLYCSKNRDKIRTRKDFSAAYVIIRCLIDKPPF